MNKAIRSALLTAQQLYKHIPHVVHNGMSRGGRVPEGYERGGDIEPDDMAAPQKMRAGYKLFKTRNGKIYPLFVDKNTPVQLGKWHRATMPEHFVGTNGQRYVKSPNTGTMVPIPEDIEYRKHLLAKGIISSLDTKAVKGLALRPGWHSSTLPHSSHIGGQDKGATSPNHRRSDEVWGEVLHPDDVDVQSEANANGRILASGERDPDTSHITDRVPLGGTYNYQTNKNAKAGDKNKWMVSGGMMLNRLLPDEEVAHINAQHGLVDLPRRQKMNANIDAIHRASGVAPPQFARGGSAPQLLGPDGQPISSQNGPGTLPPAPRPSPGGTKPEQDPDLFDYSRLSQQPNVAQFDLPRNEPARGVPERVADLIKSRSVQNKMLERIHAGLGTAGSGWYNTDPLLEQFIRHHGEEKGREAHGHFMHLVAATSPREKVPENVKKASLLYHHVMSGKDLPPEKGKQKPGEAHYPGLPLHIMNAKRYLEGSWDPRVNAKPLSFAQNLVGNWRPGTIDTHAFRLPAILKGDTRFLDTAYEPTIKGPDGKPMKAPKRNIQKEVESGQLDMKDVLPGMWQSKPKDNEYKAMEDYYKRLAGRAGVSTAQTQAGAWVGGGEETGLASDPNKTFMHFLQDRIYKTARETGVDPQTIMKDMITGKIPLRKSGGVVDQALAITRPKKAEGGAIPNGALIPPPAVPRRSLTPSGMYSHAGEQAMALPQAKGSPQQMLASLKGIKPEEMAYSGAQQAFAGQPSVTKEQLASHFRFNLPRIHETRYSDNDIDEDDEGQREGAPSYEEYTIPGGKNYRELLLHTPKIHGQDNPEVQAAFKAHQDATYARNKLTAKPDFQNDPEYQAASALSGSTHRAAKALQDAYEAKHNYKSGHWDVPNVLAHLRMSDRTLPDKSTMLHLEELQSDWGQDARTHGYKKPEHVEQTKALESQLAALWKKHGATNYTELPPEGKDEWAHLRVKMDAANKAVAPGPYIGSTNGWTDLGLKRALREAALGGHDRLAWTPDEEHDRRYEGREKAAEGEGGYYDKIIPKRLREILKKLGHEPEYEPVTFTHPSTAPLGKNVEPHHLRTTLHSVKLTPELRDKIKRGLPAFSHGGDVVKQALRVTARPAKMYAAGGGITKGPDYDVHEDDDFLHVARRDHAARERDNLKSASEIRGPGGAPVGGGAGSVGNGAAQSSSDARLAQLQSVANRHAGKPVLDAGNSESSLHKQSAIGRAFQLAASGHPGYERDVFEAYQRHHPDLVRHSGAKNYAELRAAAYKQLGKEVNRQFDDLPLQMRFHHEGKHGYASSKAMRRDVLENGKLAVFRGGDANPGMDKVDPHTRLTPNEKFRAVHDVFGHALHGSNFNADGEERAWNAHRQMFSPLAALAMSAETRGQNSFVNYTPVNAELTAKKHQIEAEIARARRFKDKDLEKELQERKKEVMNGWQYAPNKPVLLPPEMNRPDYEGGMPNYVQKHIESEPGTGFSSPISHYSHDPSLTELDPARYGTGIKGDERSRVMKRPGGVQQRAYGYLGAPGAVPAEPGLGQHAYAGQAENLYDLSKDPAKLHLLAQEANRYSPLGTMNPGTVNQGQAMNDVERMAKEHGYSGVANPKAAYPMAALFNKTPVTPAPQDATVQQALRLTAPRG